MYLPATLNPSIAHRVWGRYLEPHFDLPTCTIPHPRAWTEEYSEACFSILPQVAELMGVQGWVARLLNHAENEPGLDTMTGKPSQSQAWGGNAGLLQRTLPIIVLGSGVIACLYTLDRAANMGPLRVPFFIDSPQREQFAWLCMLAHWILSFSWAFLHAQIYSACSKACYNLLHTADSSVVRFADNLLVLEANGATSSHSLEEGVLRAFRNLTVAPVGGGLDLR